VAVQWDGGRETTERRSGSDEINTFLINLSVGSPSPLGGPGTGTHGDSDNYSKLLFLGEGGGEGGLYVLMAP
jgi:hypothetical protein